MAKAKPQDTIWILASASKYEDYPNQASFAPRRQVSSHVFGWDSHMKAFLVQNMFGFSVRAVHTLRMPAELAEMFLLRCQEQEFKQIFLIDPYPREDAEEIIGGTLKVHRNRMIQVRGSDSMPGLSLSIEGQKESIALFYELKKNFCSTITRLSADHIKARLRR